ncbi:MAG: MFS transporter [Chloroflexota bacterium]
MNNKPTLRQIVLSAMGFRLLADTSIQFIFPFLPIFADGLNVSIEEVGLLVSIRSLVGLSSPLFGWLAEKRGYRNIMRFGMVFAAVGLAVFALSPNYLIAIVGMVIMGIGTTAFVPTLFAWASALLPFEERSRGLGAIELSWALAGMFGVSAVGFAIAEFGWRPPLVFLAILLLLAGLIIGRLPGRSDVDQSSESQNQPADYDFWSIFDLGRNKVSAWAVVLTAGTIAFANIHTFSVYAQWLVDLHQLDEISLSWVAFAMGSAELLSNLGISFFGDRIGPLRGVKIASIGAIIFFGALFWLQSAGFWVFLAGLFVARYFMENAFVNNIILSSEQTPENRSKALTLMSAFGTIGLSLASTTGPFAYTNFGPIGLVVPSVLMYFITWVANQLFAKEKG